MKPKKALATAGLIWFFSGKAFAGPFGGPDPFHIREIPCKIVSTVYDTLTVISGTIVIIMFIYGGMKYVFSADDPGGRKQGKNICIHALIGGILIVSWTGINSLLKDVSPLWHVFAESCL